MKAPDLLSEWPSVQPRQGPTSKGAAPRVQVAFPIPSPPNFHLPPLEEFPPCWNERLKSRKSEMPRFDLSFTHIFHSSWALTSQKGSWTTGDGREGGAPLKGAEQLGWLLHKGLSSTPVWSLNLVMGDASDLSRGQRGVAFSGTAPWILSPSFWLPLPAAQLLAHLSPVEVNDLKLQDSLIRAFLWSEREMRFLAAIGRTALEKKNGLNQVGWCSQRDRRRYFAEESTFGGFFLGWGD